MPASDVEVCTNCNKSFTTDIITPCKCKLHTTCFIDLLIKKPTNQCEVCGDIYGNIKLNLMTLVFLLEPYMPILISGLLFLAPIFICGMTMSSINLIMWHILRTPLRNLNMKQQIIAHISCIIFPIIIGMYRIDGTLHQQYINGIELITNNSIGTFIYISHIMLFIISNMLVMLIVYVDLFGVLMKAKKISEHITITHK